MQHYFFYWLRLVLTLVAAAVAFAPTAVAQHRAALAPSPSRPVGEVLNPNGTLRAGAAGSFDATGYQLRTDSATGQPAFRVAGTGDNRWRDGFGLPGTNGIVYATAVAANGDLYVGGTFTIAGTAQVNNIAKWNGTTWSALGAGVNGRVSALAVSGTNLFVGGEFTTAGGAPANRIARWDGTAWTALGAGVGGAVNALAVSGADLYVGGAFTTAGGAPANRVARWNGTAWSALGTGVNGLVKAIAVSGANVYVGGDFTTAGGQPAIGLAKWDGTTWSIIGTPLSPFSTVNAIAVMGADVYVAGDIYIDNGIFDGGYRNIAKWDGTAWSGLGQGTRFEASILGLAVAGTDLYAVGNFVQALDTANRTAIAHRVAKWNGTRWTTLGGGVQRQTGFSAPVWGVAVSGSSVYVVGDFVASENGVKGNRVARWNGTAWSTVGIGLNGTVRAIAVSGTDVYVGGFFSSIGNCIAKWNGTAWSTLGNGLTGGNPAQSIEATVTSLAISGTNLYAAGTFTIAGGVPANNIARWNGTTWSALGTGTLSPLGFIVAVAASGPDVYVGGQFTQIGGVPATNVARWNGTTWSALGTGVNDFVRAVTISGTNVYFGGEFTTAGGVPAGRIAKWNGTTWSALGAGLPPGGVVWSLATAANGDLYAAGFMYDIGTTIAPGVAKWDGTTWSSLGGSLNNPLDLPQISAIAVAGSNVYGTGNFVTAGGTATNRIARWNGTAWEALGTGLGAGPNGSDQIYGLAVSGTDVYAGGDFTRIGDGSKVTAYFAKYDAAAPLTSSNITSFTPRGGEVGTVVTVTGTNFTEATSAGVIVTGTFRAGTNFTINSPTQLTFTVPTTARLGAGFVAVNLPSGQAIGPNGFAVTPAPPTTTGAARCGPGEVALTAAAPLTFGSFLWYTVPTGGTPIAAAVSNRYVTPSLTATTTYYVAAVTSPQSGAVESFIRTPVTATINSLPAAAVAPPQTRCAAGTLVLTASGAPVGGQYRWYSAVTPKGGVVVPGATQATYTTPVITANTTYYVSLITSDGCESASLTAIPITIDAAPAVPALAATPATAPAGTPFPMNITPVVPGVVYTWSATNATLDRTTGTTVIVTPTAAGPATVSVVASTVSGCASAATVRTFTVTAGPPTAPTTTSAARCGAGTVSLAAAGAPAGGSYRWYTGATGGTAIAGATGATYTTSSLSATTTYYVSTVDGNGLESLTRTAVTATVNAVPLVTVTASGPLAFCPGGAVTLTASGSVGATYEWQLNGTALAGATASTYAATAAGAYTVAVTEGGCTGVSAAQSVTINAAPALPALAPTAATVPATISFPMTITPAVPGVSYTWSATNATLNVTTGPSVIVTPTAVGLATVSVVALGANGCISADTVRTFTVTAGPPTAPITTGAARCGTGTVDLTAAGAPAGGSYKWYTGATGGTAIAGATGATYTTSSLSATTTYYVSTVDGNGLESLTRTAVTATINTLPQVTVTASGPLAFCPGGAVTLTASGSVGATYEWQLNGTALAGATAPTYVAITAGAYTVAVTEGSCTGVSTVQTVIINAVPATPTITQTPLPGGLVSLTSSALAGNQWYLNGVLIVGATGTTYTVTSSAQSGNYTVVATNAGCNSPPSVAVNVQLLSSAAELAQVPFSLYPNPAQQHVTIVWPTRQAAAVVELLDATGRVVRRALAPANQAEIQLPLQELPGGLYLVRCGALTRRLVVE